MRTIIFISVFTFIVGAAHAQWSTDPNINNAISTATYDQFHPSGVSDGAGGAIITWDDQRSGYANIYAQRIDSSGVVRWDSNGVAISMAANHQFEPTIISDGAGGAIITWMDLRSSTNYDIYIQRVNASGIVQWTANGVAICTAAEDQFRPAIVSDSAGGAIITWYDFRSGSDGDIYAQRIDASGVVQWTANGVAISTAAHNQWVPAIISDGAGGAIITWMDYRNGNVSVPDVYSQRVNASGVVQWATDGVANSTAVDYQTSPTIVSDGAGGAIITWEDTRNFSLTRTDIYAQRINGAGIVQWDSNGAAVFTAAEDQVRPTIVSDDAGGAIIAWLDFMGGGLSDIYAQRINASGVVQWNSNGVAIARTVAWSGEPQISAMISDGAGGAIIAYRKSVGGHFDIYAQRINASGVVQWNPNEVAISTAPGDQENPTIISDGAGGAIITWPDFRSNTSFDIYAQWVSANGRIGTTDVIESSGMPLAFRLNQNYPNPFNPSTVIRYQIPVNSRVNLKIYNVLGQEVATLVNEEVKPGSYEVTWDASGFSSGMYFYRLTTGTFTETKKLVLLR